MKSFRQHISEAEFKTRIDKVSGDRFMVMKWNAGRSNWYPDRKPFKTEKEAKAREQTLKVTVVVYERISKAWKKAHSSVPIRKFPSNEYPAKILQAMKTEMDKEFKKEFPKGPFTEAQLKRSLFSDSISHAMDSWDYLSGVIIKKGKK